MFSIRVVNTNDIIALFCETSSLGSLTPAQFKSFCNGRGLFALVVEEDGMLAGFAVAESHPKAIQFFGLEGGTDACGLLVNRLARLAGERDLCGWCPLGRRDLRRMLERRGFTRRIRHDLRGQPACFYRWVRNERPDEG